MVKNLPAMQKTQSLGWKEPLERGMATHSSILAWRILWTEEPGGVLITDLVICKSSLGLPTSESLFMSSSPCKLPSIILMNYVLNRRNITRWYRQ